MAANRSWWGFALVLALLVAWEITVRTGTVQSASWPAVTTILHSLVTGFQSEGWVGIFGSSLYRMTCGFLLAAVLGIAAGLAMGASAFMHRLLMPTFEIFRVLPIPAVVPPLIFWRHNRARK